MVITHPRVAERTVWPRPSQELRLVDGTFATGVALQLLLGKLYFERGKFKKSIRHLQAGIKGAEELEDSRLLSLGYSNLGDAYYQEGRYDQAKAAYRRALALKSVSPAPASLTGPSVILELLEDPAVPFEHAVQVDPDNVWTYYGLGLEYSRKGDYALAAAKFVECVEINPRFIPARLQLAAIYYEQGDYPAAVAQYQGAIDGSRPGDDLLPDLYFGLGDAYRAQEEYCRAVAAYQRAINALPSK